MEFRKDYGVPSRYSYRPYFMLYNCFFVPHKCISEVTPEHVRSPLLQDGLLMVVEQVAGVEHVKEVELGVDGDGGLHPCLVSSRTLLYRQLLKEWKQ